MKYFVIDKNIQISSIILVLTHPLGNQMTKDKNPVHTPQNLTVQVSDKRQETI